MDKRTKLMLLSLIAAGAGCTAAAYVVYKRRKSSGIVDLQVKIEQIHTEWIASIAEQYTDGDVDVAFQLLLNHCISASKTDPAIADTIFKKVRCKTCGGNKNKLDFSFCTSEDKYQYLNQIATSFNINGGLEKVVRIMFDYAMDDGEIESIFSS